MNKKIKWIIIGLGIILAVGVIALLVYLNVLNNYKEKMANTVISDIDLEKIVCVITVGPVESSQGWKEKMIYRMVHRGKVRPEDICEADQALPQWLKQGIRAVQLAPSAVNRHPVKLRYQEGKVLAYVENTDGYNLMDLGIAKANFEIAAGGRFEWGNPGVFIKTEQ